MPILRPLDPDFPIQAQLAVDASPIVMVVTFHLEMDEEERFLCAWKKDAEVMKRQPGFISTQLHRAVGDSVVYMNQAVWESVAAVRGALSHPEHLEMAAAYPDSVIATPHLFQKLAVSNLCAA